MLDCLFAVTLTTLCSDVGLGLGRSYKKHSFGSQFDDNDNNNNILCMNKTVQHNYYAALPSGPHYVLHSVRLSVRT